MDGNKSVSILFTPGHHTRTKTYADSGGCQHDTFNVVCTGSAMQEVYVWPIVQCQPMDVSRSTTTVPGERSVMTASMTRMPPSPATCLDLGKISTKWFACVAVLVL